MNSSNDEKIEEEIYNFLISQKLYYPIVLPLISEEKQKHFHQTKDLLIKLLTIKVSLYKRFN